MTCPVREASAPEDLAGRYSEAPDGIRVNMILSLDGCAAFDGVAGPLSNPCDQNLLLALRGYADVVLVGAGTVRAEGYGPVSLTATQRAHRRARFGTDAAPPIAVVTRTGDIPASLFDCPGQRPILITTSELARNRAELLDQADLLIAGETVVDVSAAIERLRARGLRKILCEGGPTLLDELTAADLVDEICLTISPTLAADIGPQRTGARLPMPTRLTLAHAVTVGDYVYLRYHRRSNGREPR